MVTSTGTSHCVFYRRISPACYKCDKKKSLYRKCILKNAKKSLCGSLAELLARCEVEEVRLKAEMVLPLCTILVTGL